MTGRRSVAGVALLVGATLLVVACGSSSAPTAPTTPTEAPFSAAPTTGLPGFSFALPSFTADTELEDQFPTEIGGETLSVVSMMGSDFLSTGASGNQLAPVLQQLGKSPSDLSVAFGSTSAVSVIAFRIQGVPAEQFFTAYTAAAQSQGTTITNASFGGKAVKKVISSDQSVLYLYLHSDVVWTVSGATTLTDALLNEAFSKLP
jgi:hypothetical protein